MKKTLFLTLTLIVGANLFAQWYPQNPTPTPNTLYSVCFPSENIGFAAGDSRCILKTIDAGISWEIIHLISGVNTELTAIHFVNNTVGYVCGINYFSKTIDGGLNWTNYSVPNAFYTSLFFIDESTGFVSNRDGEILKTTDGGMSWTTQQLDYALEIEEVIFVDDVNGYCAGSQIVGLDQYDGKIYQTVDAGQSWVLITTSTTRLLSIDFYDLNTGMAVGDWGYIVSTSNGGLSWEEEKVCDTCYFSAVVYFDSTTLCVTGGGSSGNIIHKSIDGGTTWYQVNQPQNLGYPQDIAYNGNDNLTIVGGAGRILFSEDQGEEWRWVSNNLVGEIKDLNSVSFYDDKIGLIVGQDATVLKTVDGGNNWLLMENELSYNMWSACFIDSNTIVVGASFGIFKSIDGGISWVKKANHSTWDFEFLSHEIGYATEMGGGTSGELFKTIDGGETWSVSYEFSESISEIQLLNDEVGYVLGRYSVFKTTDGGINWIKKVVTQESLLNSFYFTGIDTGYIVGDSKYVYKTTDGGNNWSQRELAYNNNSIRFLDQDTGIVVGYDGAIFKTGDAGESWIKQESTINYSLYSVALLPQGQAFAVGRNSSILKTDNFGGDGIYVSLPEITRQANSKFNFKVFPNPVYSYSTVSYQLEKDAMVSVQIINLQGTIISSTNQQYNSRGRCQESINLVNQPPGVYFCILNIDGNIIAEKIIKLKGE